MLGNTGSRRARFSGFVLLSLLLAACSSEQDAVAPDSASAQSSSAVSQSSSSMQSSSATSSSASNSSSSSSSATSAGALSLSATTYSIVPSVGTLVITVNRTGGSSGAASVHYATSNGTALASIDFTSASGTLNWTNGDTSAKTFSVLIISSGLGNKSFTVTLSSATGATLGTPSSSTISIGSTSTACAQSDNSWTSTGLYDTTRYGNYLVSNTNFNNTPGQQTWANSESCWGANTTSTTELGGVGSYPHIVRGWTQSDADMITYSSSSTRDWTTQSGLGILVSALTKAKVHWAFTAPTSLGSRWLGLMDIYFHPTIASTSADFPPFVDLMINQALADPLLADGKSTFYQLVANNAHATTVTLGGSTYLVYIDEPGEAGFHQAGGHNIHLFLLPTNVTDSIGANWGSSNATTDLKAIIQYFMQANPVDNNGQPLRNAAGAAITSPLIASNLYLNAINVGWEIDIGTTFKTTGFWIALQDEPDGP
jgi:hypothetical protein